MWELKNKYKDCCQNSGCDSFDTCIECWDEWAERNPPMTNADRIRAMSDEELATDLLDMFEQICEDGVPSKEWMLEWLKWPVEEGDGNG